MTIGQKLSEKRKRCGFTQDEVAERLRVTPQAVSKWEHDVSCPDISLLPEIARLYGTTVDDILSCEATPEVVTIKDTDRKNMDDMVLKIRIHERGDKVNINLPLPIIKAAVAAGMASHISIGKADLSNIDFTAVIDLVERGTMGRIMEVESSDGATVIIEVI